MRAAQLTDYDSKNPVQVNDNIARPTIGSGQVLVQVHAAGVNPFDWKLLDGSYKDYIKLDLPATLGGDVAGTVVEVAKETNGFEIGQSVYGMANAAGGQGSFAEFTPVSAKQLAAMPTSLDYPQAAALPLVGSAAYQALVENMNLRAGQKVLIHGGAGGIGSVAIQLAKHLGAYVATTAAANDTEFVKNLGADEALDYKTQDFAKTIKDYDAVFDTVGSETNTKSYQVLKRGGILVSMVERPDEQAVKRSGIKYIQQNTIASAKRLTEVAKLVDSGNLKVNVDKVFPLERAAEALEYLKSGHPRGKVVIQVK